MSPAALAFTVTFGDHDHGRRTAVHVGIAGTCVRAEGMMARVVLLLTALALSSACTTVKTLADVDALRAAAAAPVDADVVLEERCEFNLWIASSAMTVDCRHVTRYATPPKPLSLKWSGRDGDVLAVAVVTASGRAIQLDDATLLRNVSGGRVTLDLTKLVGAHDPVRLVEQVRRETGWFFDDDGVGGWLGNVLPTRHVERTITVDDRSGAVLRIFHASPNVTRTIRAGRVTFSFVLDDVAAIPREPARVDPRSFSPWMSLQFAQVMRWKRPLNEWWVLQTEAERLTKRPVDVAACTDRRCRLDAAVRSVLDRVDIVAGADIPPSLGAARNRNVAGGNQMAALIWRALVDVGEAPRIAWTSAFPSFPLDADVTDSRDINRWLVVVDGDTADAPPIWIDPRCGACTVGELPFEVRDRPAIVASVVDRQYTTAAATVVGEPMDPLPHAQRAVRMVVAADGSAVVTIDIDDFGEVMNDDGIALMPADRARRDRELVLAQYAARLGHTARSTLKLIDTAVDCDRRGHCKGRYTFTVKGSATIANDGAAMSLPSWGARVFLDFLHRAPQGRTTPLYVDDAGVSEVVTVVPPAGWRVASVPEAFQSTSPLCDVSGSGALREGQLVLERRYRCRGGYQPASAAVALNETFVSSHRFATTPVLLVRDGAPIPPAVLPLPPPLPLLP